MISIGELRRWLAEQVAETCFLDVAEVDPAQPLDEYGLSSRDAVELAGALEELLGRSLPTTLLWDHPTIDRLAAALTTSDSSVLQTAEVAPSNEPIAVVGVGCRLPGGIHGPEQFWRALTEGRDAVGEVPGQRWAEYGPVPAGTTRRGGFLDDIAGFDAEFFGIAPREAARMDPQQRMVLEVAWEALEHAGIAPGSLRGSETGVFVGVSGTEYGARSLTDVSTVDPWVGTGAALSIAANRLSYVLDLRGPSMAVDTACSSSLTAVHLAVRSLRSGESELALVGGANLLLGPAVTASFDQMGISSGDGRCKPFSADADGIARAEGAGIVVLKRLSAARADGDRVLAVIRGTATNSDGRSNGLTAPNVEAQQALLRTAYTDAGVDPASVDYVEAHGTGTLLGDPIEARALGSVLGAGRDRPLLIGSVKSNLGHLEAAAGIAGLIKTTLALHHGTLPASINYSSPNPHIPFEDLRLSVADSRRPWPATDRPALAGVSGFGFGGTNSHVVLEQVHEGPAETAHHIGRFLLGGKSEDRLREHATALADWLAGHDVALPDIEATLARRLEGRVRAAVVARTRAELVNGLRDLAVPAPHDAGHGPVFVFSGHGSQWAGMGRSLLAEEPVFAAAIDRLDPLIKAEAGFSLRDDLRAEADATTMDHVQPLVFGLQVALAEVWAHYGVRPSAVIGHSFGEVAAAVVAGALTEADGARVVALRSRLLASLAGDGAMALLEVDAREAERLVGTASDVDIAVLTSPAQTVIAGDAPRVREIVSIVESSGRLAKLVKLDVAAHSPIVDQVTGRLVQDLAGLSATGPELDFYSTALTDPRERPAFDPDYWARNLRQPVRFSAAVDAATEDGYRTFVELSPHPVLRHALLDNRPDALVASSLRDCPDEVAHFHEQLAALEIARQATPVRGGAIVDVPTTPWRHTRHWLPAAAPIDHDRHPLLGSHTESPDDGKHLWRAEKTRADDPIAAFVEMAIAAGRTAFGVPTEQITVRALRPQAPLGDAATTTLTPGGSFRVHSKAPDGTWRLHAAAEVSVAGQVRTEAYLSAADETGFVPVTGAFPGLRHIRASETQIVAEVLPSDEAHHPRLSLPPALVGSCLRVFAAVGQRPVELGAVRVYGDPARGHLVHVSTRDGRAELHLVDTEGQVLLEVTDIVLRPESLSRRLLEAAWRQAPAAAHGNPGTVAVIGSDQLAEALDARAGLDADGVLFTLPRGGSLADAERAVLAIADTVRALADRPRAPRLLLVTTGAFSVTPGEIAEPAFAALRGLVRVLACEHPELRPGIVDLDPLWTAAEAAEALRAELASGTDDEVAWRSGVRYARRLDRVADADPGTAPVVRPGAGYVVTGGLGGLGIFIAGWLAEQGAGRIVLNGRSAPKPGALGRLAETGPTVEVVLGDIAEPGVAERLIDAAGPDVRGVVHAAAVLDDRTTTQLDAETLHRSWLPKAYGAWRLHEATRDLDLDWWVGFSSAAALHGSPGQPSYAAGNAYLDALVAMRRAQGLPGTSIAWGTWAEIGAAANLDIPWLHPIQPAEGLDVLAAALGRDLAHVGALRLNTPRLVAAFPQLTGIPFFEPILGHTRDEPSGADLSELPSEAARSAASAQLRERVASVLGFAPDRLDIHSPLSALGVDSLLAVRIRNAVQHDFAVSLPVSLLLRGASVTETEQWLFDELGLGSGDAPASPVVLGPRDAAERLVAGAWRDVLGVAVGVTEDFYGVGGDRARAERVTTLLAERSGRELTISELFEHPTIERMAAHLREEEHGGSPLRVLRGEGTKTPLFFFHPGGGDTAVYAQLTQLLDPAVPVYGFDRLEGVSSVEDRVRRYLPELRAVQPHGPYRLAGWSFGGFLAFETAQQLRSAGEQVEVLAMIDSIIPLPNDTGLSDVELTERRFERFAEFLEASYGRKIRLPYERLARLGDEEQVQLLVDTMRDEGLVTGAVSDAILHHQRTSLLDTRSLERYTPLPYDGPVSFFSAAEETPGGLRDHRFDRRDPARGWDAVCDALEVIPVPGHHLSLLDPPHVDEIGRRLSSILTATMGALR